MNRKLVQWVLVLGVWAMVGVAAAGAAPAAAAPGTPVRLKDSILEPQALNFPKGQFGTCINGQTFQYPAIVTSRGWQYATWFDAKGRLCVGRRHLPDGPWQNIAFDDYSIKHTDVHNVSVIGVCEADGTVHLTFDHHGSPLHYRVSKAGAATKPQDVEWTAALFGPVTSELAKGVKLARVTYPEFFPAPGGRLQLYYRIGGSGNGDSHLATYDPARGGWTVLGEFTSGKGEFQGSPSRNAYHNGFDYGPDGRLHTTWTWREGKNNFSPDAGGLLNCHDLMYAASDDGGATWKSSAGQIIGTTARQSIVHTSPGVTVRPLPFKWGIMNQVTQTVDRAGRIHVVMWHQPTDAAAGSKNMNSWRYFHYWRDAKGVWHDQLLPCVGRKPSLLAGKDDSLVLVFTKPADLEYHGTDPGGPLMIYKAAPARDWADWREVYRSEKSFVGEPRLDAARWQQDGILSVYAQEAPAAAGKPSPLHVMDFEGL